MIVSDTTGNGTIMAFIYCARLNNLISKSIQKINPDLYKGLFKIVSSQGKATVADKKARLIYPT